MDAAEYVRIAVLGEVGRRRCASVSLSRLPEADVWRGVVGRCRAVAMRSSHAGADFTSRLAAGSSDNAAGEGVYYASESQWLLLSERKNPQGP